MICPRLDTVSLRLTGQMITIQTIPHSLRRFITCLMIAAAMVGTTVAAPVSESHLAIDTSQSAITVRVFKTGLFRSFGDNHEIHAFVKSGFIKNTLPIQANIVAHHLQR